MVSQFLYIMTNASFACSPSRLTPFGVRDAVPLFIAIAIGTVTMITTILHGFSSPDYS